MKETEFATFVNREREEYRKLPQATRPDIDTLIPTFMDKQTNMESDSKWNKLSMEQAQILSLMVKVDSKMSRKRSVVLIRAKIVLQWMTTISLKGLDLGDARAQKMVNLTSVSQKAVTSLSGILRVMKELEFGNMLSPMAKSLPIIMPITSLHLLHQLQPPRLMWIHPLIRNLKRLLRSTNLLRMQLRFQ